MHDNILLISDSHGHFDYIQTLLKKETEADVIIHCGDGISDLLRVDLPSGMRKFFVRGNVDRYTHEHVDENLIIEAGTWRILVTHGDRYNVKTDLASLEKEGKRQGADLIFFGHTHKPYFSKGSPVIVNPGALSTKQYAIVNLGSDITVNFHSLEGA